MSEHELEQEINRLRKLVKKQSYLIDNLRDELEDCQWVIHGLSKQGSKVLRED